MAVLALFVRAAPGVFVDFVVDATGTPGTENMDEKTVRKIVGELLESGFARVVTTKKYLKQ